MTKKEIKDKIIEIYERRGKAHDEILECDIDIDRLFSILIENRESASMEDAD